MDSNSITVLTWARNEKDIMPFFLRYYSSFADRIIVWDNHSDDGTQDIVRAFPNAELRNWDTGGDFNEIEHTRVKESAYKETGSGWKIVVDTDEFVWAHKGMREVLSECDKNGLNLVISKGFDMVSEEMPVDDGVTQLPDLVKHGVHNPRYNKVCIFKQSVDVHYEHGCHTCRAAHGYVTVNKPFYCLLHYKFLGRERVIERAKWMQSVVVKEQQDMGINVELTDMEHQAGRWDSVWENRVQIIG